MPLFFQFIQHLLKSKRRHGVHSPFVYGLGDSVLKKTHFTLFDSIAPKRRVAKTHKILGAFLSYIHAHESQNPLHKLENKHCPLDPIPHVDIVKFGNDLPALGDNHIIICYSASTRVMDLESIHNKVFQPTLLLDLFFIQILISHEMVKYNQNFFLK